MTYGELISTYRKESGLTLDELAEKSGVPKGTINKIISGATKAPTLPNMKALAKAMGKTLADFDDGYAPETEKAPPISDGDRNLLDMYHRLDAMDQGFIMGEMRVLLLSDKYQQEVERRA